MEKDRSRTDQVGSSRGVLPSLSLSPPPFLNYPSTYLGIPEMEMMMTASSSSQNDLPTGPHHHQSLVDCSRGVLGSSLVPPPPPSLNHRSNDLRMPEVDMLMTASSSHQNNLLMEPHHDQNLVGSHNEALFQLKETAKQARELQEENFTLKMINTDLSNRLALLLDVTSDHAALFEYPGMGMDPNMNLNAELGGLGMMNLGSDSKQGPHNWADLEVAGESPSAAGVIDSAQVQESEEILVDRLSLPKSISVRSDNYLKTVQPGGSSASRGNKILKRSKSSGKQKVYVPGEENVDKPLALEVYNQGMSKTELCNKWQETGVCPYETQCQFAHGLEELRPVLRHPRYKTEVCRMVLNGDPCNYGHRCHFRHALTDKENFMRSINLRWLDN